ncbi:MAG: DUF262 domain-containing protein [Thermodesulfobacteriota bacterium]
MGLNEEIETMRKEIRTDGYAMSIGEWISLYESKEIDIHPDFQRFYRWSGIQKSNLIESILMGIPIPPIFVSQRQDGVWDVIDGLQRLSTLYQFVGSLKDENGETDAPLRLEKTKYLPSLEGKKWNDPEDPDNSLTAEQRLLIKRTKIGASIIMRESDRIAKYELFQRLNTGGANLTPQEVRNCIMVMVNPGFHEWITTLSAHQSFQECIALSEKNRLEQYDLELALRFLVFSTLDIEHFDLSEDVGEYLTDRMVEMATGNDFDAEEAEIRFRETFDHICAALGESAFRRFDGKNFKGGFLLSPYEVIACGLGFDHPTFPSIEDTAQRTRDLYSNEVYQKWSGSGVAASRRWPHLIPLGREMFRR